MLIPRDKPWALFAGDDYYPLGGPGDFVEAFATSGDAVAHLRTAHRGGEWATVVNIDTGEEIGLQRSRRQWDTQAGDYAPHAEWLTDEQEAARRTEEQRQREEEWARRAGRLA